MDPCNGKLFGTLKAIADGCTNGLNATPNMGTTMYLRYLMLAHEQYLPRQLVRLYHPRTNPSWGEIQSF